LRRSPPSSRNKLLDFLRYLATRDKQGPRHSDFDSARHDMLQPCDHHCGPNRNTKPQIYRMLDAEHGAHAPHHRDFAASGSSAISLQIAESLKQLEKGSPPLGGDDDPTILSRNQVFNLEDSVSVQASLKIFVQIFVQPPRKFSDVRKLTQGTVFEKVRNG